MKVGIIDCGTNTFNLIIAEIIEDGKFHIRHKAKKAVKLGQGGINNKTIVPDAFQRGLDALKEHQTAIEKSGAEKTFAFATSAIRSAANGNDFVKAAKAETNVEINVISGQREAELIYKGVKLAVGFNAHNSLIIDVGGGSTEFIIANNSEVLWKHSFDIGVARLIEFFKPSNPIKNEEKANIENYLAENLSPLFDALKENPCSSLIGCSGSFETFASIILHKQNNIEQLDNSYIFDLKDFAKLNSQLLLSTEEERMQTPGLPESRVDSIVSASIYVNYLLNKLGLKELKLSLYAIKEGILSELVELN